MAVAKYLRSPYKKETLSKGLEISVGESETQQNLNLTVREMLYKMTSGNLPDIQHEALSEGDEVTFDDYCAWMEKDYDLADMTRDKLRLMELKQITEAKIEEKEKLRKAQKQKDAEDLERLRKMEEEYKKLKNSSLDAS